MAEATIGGIPAGATGDAETLFLKRNHVAIGWDPMGNLAAIPPNREASQAEVARVDPDAKAGAIPNITGQLDRFVHEREPGDILADPSKWARPINLGRVPAGDRHDPTVDAGDPNLREARWIAAVPRERFTQGAPDELGSAMSLFPIRIDADESRAAEGDKVVPVPVDADETVAAVAEDIEETARDFVFKTPARDLKGHPFAHFVAHLLNTMGDRTRVAPPGPDGGVDIVAHRDELGFEPPIIPVPAQSGEGKVGDPEVSSLSGKVGPHEHGLLVTLGSFTAAATTFGRSKSNLRLIDGDELVDLVLGHYDQFDSRYKGLLPLKRVYVPESLVDRNR